MKVGLFFGSFNPIHIGHLIICSYIVDFTDLDQVWFVVSPHNPLKEKKTLLNSFSRLELVQAAIEEDERFKAIDIEFSMPQPSYTIDTLDALKKKFKGTEFSLIMGMDTVDSLPKWKSFDRILNNYRIIAYPRPGYSITQTFENHKIEIVEDVPHMEISATFIRKCIKEKKNISIPPSYICFPNN